MDYTEEYATEVDKETFEEWKNEIKQCYWIYANNTDYFVRTKSSEYDEEEVFVRTINGGWFSIGGFMKGGQLDVDGEFLKDIDG